MWYSVAKSRSSPRKPGRQEARKNQKLPGLAVGAWGWERNLRLTAGLEGLITIKRSGKGRVNAGA